MKKKSLIGALAGLVCLILAPTVVLAAETTDGGYWINQEQNLRYINSDGTSPANQWSAIKGNWYYFDGNGITQTGWLKHGEVWYYMNDQGAMQTGWLQTGNKWYYMNENGAMRTGWLRLNDKWYFLNSSGAMQTEWLNEGGKWYYLNQDGAMAIGNRSEESSIYKFDSNGSLKSIYVDSKEPFGSFSVVSYNEYEQVIADTLNELREKNNFKALVSDQKLNEIAKFRLDSAIAYGYYTKGKSITGQGTIKEYLKTVGYLSNKGGTEVYIRAASSIEDAISKFQRDTTTSSIFTKATTSGTIYKSMGVSVIEKNEKIYVMLILMN